MRERPVAVFFAGFAFGLLFLAALLWGTGRFRNTHASVAPDTPSGSKMLAAHTMDAHAPGVSQPSPYQPIAAPPVPSQPAPPTVEGPAPASRDVPDAAPPQRKLMIPVEGVHAAELRDNFNDMRGGHRHEALDIMAPRGAPVLAADGGNVVKLFLSKPGGLTVYQFDDSQTYCYYYAHLDRYAPGLRQGALLRKGEVLGYVGSTGDASPTAPHLHFAIFKLGPEKHWWEGVPIDPYGILTDSAGR